ncbi:MAG: FMN-dependent NADH-azoreductase [Blastochloris viridis]|uniref:FMN dependent NADH:quinone oxidoreductase n=1 Tax=Blastochloris viridis TaxID=1079 RepID=A0A6N4RBR2_BLAVI|nr:MAG: FMN-dependent NADH-azoreductase [Blastochloris viridis]
MNILQLDSSITGDASVSRQISAQIVAKLKTQNPSAHIVKRDLVATPLAHLTLPEFGTPVSAEVLAEFQAADVLVIGVPLYNFSIPSQLKAWVDRIAVAGQTFKYTENGPVGLAGGKRLILVASRGGLYGEGMPAAPMEHAVTYLKAVFGFLGITDIEVVVAEGVAMGPDAAAAALASAQEAVAALA